MRAKVVGVVSTRGAGVAGVVTGWIAALALDLFFLPDLPVVWIYAVPVLLAAYRLRPPLVAITGLLTLAVYTLAVWLQDIRELISVYFGVGLLLISGLATLLAYHREAAMARAARAEAAEREADRAHAVAEEAHGLARRQVARIHALAEASRAFASEFDLQPLLETITREAGRLLGDGSALYVVADDRLVLAAIYHPDSERVAFLRQLFAVAPLQHDEGIGGQVVQTGHPVRLPVVSPEQHRILLRPEHWPVVERLRVHSALGVPLRMRERVLGVLMLWRDGPGLGYTEDDEVFLQELADRAALAVERARLYEFEREAVRVRDEFISVASHELRTPITSLRGFSQQAHRYLTRIEEATKTDAGRQEADSGQVGESRHFALDIGRLQRALQVIVEQADRLDGMIRELLDVSRIGSGKLVLNRRRVDLVGLVAQVVAQAQGTPSRNRIVVRAPESVPAEADPLRIEQVLVNLLINAINHSQGDGPIEIEVAPGPPRTENAGRQDADAQTPGPEAFGPPREGEISEAARAQWVQISVRDHGVGVPPEKRSLLFQRFYQAHGEGHAGGMGLGLYISKQLVEAHGGQIHAEFPTDGGTRFVVTLPLVSASNDGTGEQAHEPE
jgi:signal transduction histidine kinase